MEFSSRHCWTPPQLDGEQKLTRLQQGQSLYMPSQKAHKDPLGIKSIDHACAIMKCSSVYIQHLKTHCSVWVSEMYIEL